jgi:hypothetical protein
MYSCFICKTSFNLGGSGVGMFKSREVSAGTSHLHMYFSFVYNETGVINYCMTRFAEPVFPIARFICLTSDACENAISIIHICRTES